MKRRDFVRNSILISGGLIVSTKSLAAGNSKKKSKNITILHTNDTHSNLEPFPANHAKFPNMGGVEKRFNLVKKIRSEEEHVLLLDAGDIFQGTPYFNRYGGILEMKAMSILGYEAATMGNHDFDGGMEGFLAAKQFANFPFLCANYDFSDTILHQQTQKSMIIQKGDVKIGIFGLGVELEGLVAKENFGETRYLDPIKAANEEAEKLHKENCDLIICLSHLGYSYESDKISDLQLARCTRNIHLILGGHTHTFLEKPTEEKNLDGNSVLINQVGWGGVQLGRIDFSIEKKHFSKKDSIIIQ
ncbi:MAG: metallophosphatase [Bacteroidota bacterium]